MTRNSENGQGRPAGPRRANGAEHTREALIRAGLRQFGAQGFDAASTRLIAAEAGANIGSIAYHFDGKEGLREACAQYIVKTISQVAGGALGGVVDASPGAAASPEEAEEMLVQALQAMVEFLVARPEAGDIVQFILRELAHPTGALDVIYAGVFEPVHARLCGLWEAASGEPAESEQTKIAVFTAIGQVVYFRIAQEPVKRRMSWKQIGPREARMVAKAATDNLRAMLRARRRKT